MAGPRWKEIADSIRADIADGKLTAGTSLPTETELAEIWSVCRVTAHRAMHELHRQGVVVRKRRAGTIVAYPQKRMTGQIAVLLNSQDTLEQGYLAGIRQGLQEEYDLLLCDVHCDPQREAQYLRRMGEQADGILCIPTCDPHNARGLRNLVQSRVPLVFLDCMPEELVADAVVSDNFAISQFALQKLIGRGHQRIAFFTEDRNQVSSLQERLDAYLRVISENGLEASPHLMRAFPSPITQDSALLLEPVQEALVSLLREREPPTAIFCVHDYVLAAVARACRELGEMVPENFEILSYNDCPPVTPYLPDNVHRIVQQAQEIGRVAAERLYRKMNGEVLLPEIIRISPVYYPAGANASIELHSQAVVQVSAA
jgi:DNA-binding LacI/PurR family transcriptional regulator